jgi:predicted SAM-dependent methyltransferase
MNHLPKKHLFNKRKIRLAIDEYLRNLRISTECALNLGCGEGRIENLLNCDLYDEHADLKLDALDLSQYKDGSVDHIETHHMIEHLSLNEAESALKEWHRALKEGGFLVITCPDFRKVVFKWVKYWFIAPFFNPPKRREYIMKMFYGNQENPGQFHKYAYDSKSLKKKLEDSGFEVLFWYSVYPRQTTPSMIFIARKRYP